MKRGFLFLVILVALVPMAYANGWATVVSSFSTSGYCDRPTSITYDGSDFWISDSYSSMLYKVTTGGSLITSYNISSIVYPAGVTWDGSNLWTHSTNYGLVNTIYQVSPSSGAILGSFSNVINYLYPYDMEYVSGNLWCVSADPDNRKAYSHNGSTGAILSSFTTQAKYPVGICYDGTNLLITGNTDNLTYRYSTSGTLIDYVSNSPFSATAYDGGSVWVDGYMYQSCRIQKMVYKISIDWGPHAGVEPQTIGIIKSIYR